MLALPWDMLCLLPPSWILPPLLVLEGKDQHQRSPSKGLPWGRKLRSLQKCKRSHVSKGKDHARQAAGILMSLEQGLQEVLPGTGT